MLTTSIFFCYTLLIHELPCRVPRDITSASPAKNVETKGEPPKVDKPLSPSARKIIPEMPNLLGSEVINVPTGAVGNPTFAPATDWSHDAAHQPSRSDPTIHQDASPIGPKSFGLRVLGGPQPGESSSVLGPEKQPQPYSCLAKSLWDNPDIIQVEFHIWRYVSASVNTQAEQEYIKALYSSMKTTNELIDVSFYAPLYLLTLRPDSLLIQVVVKHSRDKGRISS
jgi:hypothetical protein